MTIRPAVVVAVVGVATDVGKTWVATAVLTRLEAAGMRVAARKPVQSFEANTGMTDADFLAAATGEDPTTVCPTHRWYPLAMAPPIAARRLGLGPIAVHDLVAELAWPSAIQIGVIETVGGARSPMADDADSATFVRSVVADHVLLVANAGLGAINAVRLCATALEATPFTVVLNRFDRDDAVHETNRAWLADRDGFSVVTTVDDCVAAVLELIPIGGTDPDGRLAG